MTARISSPCGKHARRIGCREAWVPLKEISVIVARGVDDESSIRL
jgi:hypothetical protein